MCKVGVTVQLAVQKVSLTLAVGANHDKVSATGADVTSRPSATRRGNIYKFVATKYDPNVNEWL